MEESDKSLLMKKRTTLAKDMLCDEVLHILVEKGVLNDHMVEKICSKSTNFHKNVELLTLLPKRGPFAFQRFISALRSSDQSHLADALQPSIQMESAHGNRTSTSSSDQFSHFSESSHDRSFNLSNFSYSSTQSTESVMSRPVPSSGADSIAQSTMEFQSGSGINKRSVVPPNKNMVDCPVAPKRRRMTDPKFPEESMETVPSPCDPLLDILSTSSASSLLSASKLTLPKSTSAMRSNTSFCSNLSIQSSGHLSACDLADGPTMDDLMVRRSRHQFQQEHEMDCYEMASNPRGLALIISVDQFEPSACLDNRSASDVDRARLEFVLRQLGFKCYILVDGTAQEIRTVLEKFATLEDHERCDVSMVVVMSHGEEGSFFGRDGGRVIIDDVVDLFSNEKCKALQNKPKILLFQSCRGESPDKGVDEADGPTMEKNIADRIKPPESDRLSRSSSRSSMTSMTLRNKLPSHSDCLVGYATVKGFAAMRNTKYGSWFIQALVRVLAYHACDKHILEVMTMVNNLVKGREGWSPSSAYHRCKEMSIFHTTLCKKLYFFPGL